MPRLKLRRNTPSQWVSTNPVLAEGEPGIELGTDVLKIGNGIDTWLNLQSINASDSRLTDIVNDESTSFYAAVIAGFMRGQVVTHPRWGAVGNDIANDSPAINNALDWLKNNGGGVCIIPELKFRCDSSLVIGSNTHLMGMGPNSILHWSRTDTSTPVHFIKNANQTTSTGNSNITITNLAVHGSSTGGPLGVPSSPGVTVLMKFMNNLRVENVHFYRCFGPALHFQGTKTAIIRGNYVEDCGRGGLIGISLASWGLSDVVLSGNVIRGVGDDAIAINTQSASAPLARRITIGNNTINGVNLVAANEEEPDDGGRGILIYGAENLTISGNTIIETASRAISVQESFDNVRSNHITIDGNTCRRNGPVGSPFALNGINVRETDYLTLGANSVAESGAQGVTLNNCTHVKGGPLNIDGCGSTIGHFGVYVTDCVGVDLDVYCEGNAGPGVKVVNSDEVTIRGTCVDNSGAGDGTLTSQAGVVVDTTGAVSLHGVRSYDTRTPKLQSRGLAVINQIPSSLSIIGGDYTGNNHASGIALSVTPTILIKRGVLESASASGNYDQDIVGGVSSYRQQFTAIKSADTIVNNSATPVDDPHLSVPVGANAVYEVTAFLDFSSSTVADFLMGWTAPTGATMDWTANGLSSTASAGSGSILRNRGTVGSTAILGGIGAGSHVVALPMGHITTAATAGNLVLRWSQNTLEVSDTILYAKSWIKVNRIA